MVLILAALTAGQSLDWRVFRANDTLLGTLVSCSEAEKACFTYNRILHRPSGKCYPLWAWEPCKDTLGSVLFVDPAALEESPPTLKAVCTSQPPCPEAGYRMAYDGVCRPFNEVAGSICRDPDSPWFHFFGNYECTCRRLTCPKGTYIEQPPKAGECRFPNFRDDLSRYFAPSLPNDSFACSEDQSACFSQDKVFYSGKCYNLGERGPCAEKTFLALDKKQMQAGRVAVSCISEERCPPGTRFMTYREECVAESEIRNVLCADSRVYSDAFGETVCSPRDKYFSLRLAAPEPRQCKMFHMIAMAG